MIQPISLISPGPYYAFANMYAFRRDAPSSTLRDMVPSQPITDIIDLSPEARMMLANQKSTNPNS